MSDQGSMYGGGLPNEYPLGYAETTEVGRQPSRSSSRDLTRGGSRRDSRIAPQWHSWRTPRPRSLKPQPVTINLTFGGPGGQSQALTINTESQQQQRKQSSSWIDEVERYKMNAPPLWNSGRPGDNDLKVNLFRDHDLPQFPYEKIDDYGNEKGSYPDEKANYPFPLSQQVPMYVADRPPPVPPLPESWIVEPVKSGFLKMVQNFDFKWYGGTMGTGIVSILLFTFSTIYTDAKDILVTLSTVFYVANAILFSLIFLMTILRYLLYPQLFMMMVSDPGQAMYLGTFPMGFATLVTMTVNITVPKFGGVWIDIAWAFWWVDVVVSMLIALGIPWLLQIKHHGITDLEKMTAGWLLPIVAPIVAAATGAIVASELDPDRAFITICVSYAILGTGLPTALSIIVVYFLRLATKKLPPTEHMFSVFLPLGPLGQGGFAAQKLGEQAMRVFPLTNTLPAVSGQDRLLVGEIFFTVGFMVAIILWGFGLLWLTFATLSVTRQKIPFSQGWWASTFPLGVFATSTLTMGINLPSTTFQVLGTIFAVIVMLCWLMVVCILISKLVGGKKYDIFKAPEVTGAHNKRKG